VAGSDGSNDITIDFRRGTHYVLDDEPSSVIASITPNNRGQYQVSLPAGSYTMTVHGGNYMSINYTITLQSDHTLDFNPYVMPSNIFSDTTIFD